MPVGQYYAVVEKDGYKNYQSEVFDIRQAQPVTLKIQMVGDDGGWFKKLFN